MCEGLKKKLFWVKFKKKLGAFTFEPASVSVCLSVCRVLSALDWERIMRKKGNGTQWRTRFSGQ